MEKTKCKACLRKCNLVDIRQLCTHCAIKIDRADSEASDINGIREDMYNMGIPTIGFNHITHKVKHDYADYDEILSDLLSEEDEYE